MTPSAQSAEWEEWAERAHQQELENEQREIYELQELQERESNTNDWSPIRAARCAVRGNRPLTEEIQMRVRLRDELYFDWTPIALRKDGLVRMQAESCRTDPW